MTPQDQQQQQIQSVGGTEQVREQDKVMLVLAYLGLFSLIPFLTVKDSEYVKWHSKQGLVLCVAVILVALIPFVGWCLAPLGAIAIGIVAISKALKGERWRIPLLSDLADKF